MIPWLMKGYLLLNTLIYGSIAVRTIIDPDRAAAAVKLDVATPAGRSEFLTTYAGLMLALAAIFTIFAVAPDAQRLGLKAALVFYVAVLACRLLPPLVAGDRYSAAAGPAGIETLLLLGALVLLLLSPISKGSSR